MMFWKSVITLTIWTFVAGIIITGMIVGTTDLVPITITALIAASVSTVVVHAANEESSGETRKQQSTEKGKRTAADPDAKMRLLMEMMDDDERAAFKNALKHQILHGRESRLMTDGELNYDADMIASMLEDDERNLRR